MPHSLVLNLLPLSSIPQGYLNGRHLHALFLNLVSSVDRKLGDYLHQSESDKAFTLSPLQPLPRRLGDNRGSINPVPPTILRWQHTKSIPEQVPCWWRVSLLDDTLFGQLTHLWLNLNPDHPWHLGPADIKITSILGTLQSPQPWANACTYDQLYQEASETERSFTFIFATPTAFRQGKYDTSLPTKECVFNSLLTRWHKYSGIQFADLSLDLMFPSFFDIHTEVVADSRSKFIGCVGEVTYRLLAEVDPLQVKQFNALADFALFCGIGRKTTMGMGMTRRLQNQNSKKLS